MNNLIVTFATGATEAIIENFDTNQNAVTGVIVKGTIKADTTLSFTRQSNDATDTAFYQYTDYEGAALILPIYSNAWMGVNPWTDLLSIINQRGKLKLILSKAQDNDVVIELLFLINVL